MVARFIKYMMENREEGTRRVANGILVALGIIMFLGAIAIFSAFRR